MGRLEPGADLREDAGSGGCPEEEEEEGRGSLARGTCGS